MMTQSGRFSTPHASNYLQQLCKHFSHKVPVEYDASEGNVSFPFGPACLESTEGALLVKLSGPSSEALAKGRSVIDSHLKTFAFREGFSQMDWQEIDQSPGQSA